MSSGASPSGGIIDSTGTKYAAAIPRLVTVVGPNPYAANGIPVDCSAFFSSIKAVVFCRVFTTATGLSDPIRMMVIPNGGSGTDTYANAKFRALVGNPPPHTHLYDKANTPTGDNNAAAGVGAGPHQHALTYTNLASGAASTFNPTENTGSNMNSLTFEFLVWGIPI